MAKRLSMEALASARGGFTKSATGWPSFWAPLKGAIGTITA
jgi:peptide methionine sulfoxide reductase MsrB